MFRAVPERPVFLAAAAITLVAGALLLSAFVRSGDRALFCNIYTSSSSFGAPVDATSRSVLSSALLHYATTTVVPQQSRAEISISFEVLRRRAPCNFLVFGLGRDSPMWAALNAGGTTVFLEEDPEWYQSVLKASPDLRAHHVKYRTRLDRADELLRTWRSVPECAPGVAYLKGNRGCRLALDQLPEEIYEREWDLIMIDAPKGYYAAAPGRMAAIFSAAVMGRRRQGEGKTDVFLHDVDRKVEKAFAMEFLCKKYMAGGTGRLWHFELPAVNDTSAKSFC